MSEVLSIEEARLLASIGMLGVSRGDLEAAENIFAALSLARPGAEIGSLGRALVLMAKGDAPGAIIILNAAEPSDAIYFFLAIAMRDVGREAEAKDLLENLSAVAAGPIGDAARSLLSQIEN